MKALLWISAGAAAVGVFLLARGDSEQAPSTTPEPVPPPPPPSPIYGETVPVPLAVPAGWRRATNAQATALPELTSRATALLNAPGFTSMQYGTLAPFTASDGRVYATWIEQHYHEPGGALRPWGLHHGVTLLAQTA